jgi:HEPN domain-containing protein
MRQAGARLKDAKEALSDGNYPYTVRLSQECVELCLKAVLKAVGIEYPKVHDVSDVLVRVKERFPEWFRKEVGFLSECSQILESKREPSFYGQEGEGLSPEEVMSKDDAEDAVRRAERVFGICSRFLEELRSLIH